MVNWGDASYSHRLPLSVFDPMASGRADDPVRIDLVFDLFRPHPDGVIVADHHGRHLPTQITRSVAGADGRLDACSLVFLCDIEAGSRGPLTFHVYLSDQSRQAPTGGGIQQLEPTLSDGVRRLDTGHYILEFCRGTAKGHGGAKWGIRYIEAKRQGINLIHNCHNAIGGVYGPFFSPENGLVNPPAHMVIDIEPVFEGPVACRYRFKGVIPTGLRPELANKELEIIWTFFANTPWFTRTYFIDGIKTTIDGKPVLNRITVGDELESGKNNLLLSGYMHQGGTSYRPGDLYAMILLDRIRKFQANDPEAFHRATEKLGIDQNEDPSHWHWDNYWRIFCALENAIDRAALEREVEGIWQQANEVVWSDHDHNRLKFTYDMINVSREPEQTIFPLDARRTCEFDPKTGYAFLHYANRDIPRMQIVQRYESGWVNWGTNGENEYPELPLGSTIWAAYGKFSDWQAEIARVENPVIASCGPLERYYIL